MSALSPRRRGNYEQAEQYYRQSLDIQEDVGKQAGQCRVLNSLAALARWQRQYDTAAECLDRVDEKLTESDTFEARADYHRERAAVARERTNFESGRRGERYCRAVGTERV